MNRRENTTEEVRLEDSGGFCQSKEEQSQSPKQRDQSANQMLNNTVPGEERKEEKAT